MVISTQVVSTTGKATQLDDIGSCHQFATTDLQVVFGSFLGSYMGDWDKTDNFLRAFLGCQTYTLATFWNGKPMWFTHHMGSGQTIGYSTLINQNNVSQGLYRSPNIGRGFVDGFYWDPAVNPNDAVNAVLTVGMTHVSLLGDPTLRLDVIKPPLDLRHTVSGGTVTIAWTASPANTQPGCKGYHVYRATTTSGPWTKLTTSGPITAL